MTPEQEAAVLKGHEDITKFINEIGPTLKSLPGAVAELAKNHTDLSQKVVVSTQEQAITALKSKYPDVPESVIRALPEATRDTECKVLQDHTSKIKSAIADKIDPKDPLALWARAGGIGPTDEAAIAAERQEKEKVRQESRSRGDVVGMIQSRSKEILAHLGQTFGRA